ncbi:MAG: LuxR C-terminal-related transcriptional regulator [Bacteroidales bacterium]|nr:LuxR C-terminal-related transcriptional regulator [Bacteroidales bacterium]MCF8334267.1 LuxR C-terminal-related transcriptional regulator [Bacteroidales bacterium]
MAGQKIAIISDALMLRKGLRSFLSEYFDQTRLEEFRAVKDFLASYRKSQFEVIFVQNTLFREIAGDENMLKQLSDMVLIALIPENETGEVPAFFHDAVVSNINDEEMMRKLEAWKESWMNDRLFGNNDRELTQREINILKQVAIGKTNKQIAEDLFLSPHTVITHRKNITRKLGVYTVSGLTVYALINNLINPSDVSK